VFRVATLTFHLDTDTACEVLALRGQTRPSLLCIHVPLRELMITVHQATTTTTTTTTTAATTTTTTTTATNIIVTNLAVYNAI